MLPAPHRDSDWPVSTLTAPLSAWVDCVAGVLREDEFASRRASVLSENAEEVYRLPSSRGPAAR